MEEDGDQTGGKERDAEAAAGLEECADARHDQAVERDDAGGKRGVDERAVDDEVDVIQAVAKDRDARRNRDRDVGQNHGRGVDLAVDAEEFEAERSGETKRDDGGRAEHPLELLALIASRPPKPEEKRRDSDRVADRREQDGKPEGGEDLPQGTRKGERVLDGGRDAHGARTEGGPQRNARRADGGDPGERSPAR